MPAVRCLALALVALALIAPVAAAAPASGAPAPAIVVGDSLAVGIRPFLGPLVLGYDLRWDAVSGRTTPQGMRALRLQLRVVRPSAVVVSLGSNDGPSPARFADRLRRLLGVIPPDACVVWPSIVRPPRKGEEAGLNRVLRAAALRDPRLTVVDWIGAVRAGRVFLPDGLHPDPPGYEQRSRMIAAALQRGCDARDTGAAHAPGGAAAPPA